jgi:hypothetical protein
LILNSCSEINKLASFSGVPAMDYYMVEIFESSSMTFNSSWAAIIVRMAEIISKTIRFNLTANISQTIKYHEAEIGLK